MSFISLVLIAVLPCAYFGAKTKSVTYEFTVIRRDTLERTASVMGDVLAESNTDMLKLKREQQLPALKKAQVNYELQLIYHQSQEALALKNFISEYELKNSQTTLENLEADLRIAEANLKSIETEINQYIISPIDGIVLERNVNVGDTVVESSSSKPHLSNIFHA